MTDKSTAPKLDIEELQYLRHYVDAGGQLDHGNAVDLLEELEGRWNYLIEECALAAERDLTDREWVKDKNSEKLLQRAGDNVRALKT
jgi:hypothetical protein